MKNLLLAVGGLAVAAVPPPAVAQAARECTIGHHVIDDRGTEGVIVSARGDQCLIKYDDRQTHGWARLQTLRTATPAKSGAPPRATPPEPGADQPSGDPLAKNRAEAVAIFRPAVSNRLVYHADPRGHVLLTAAANGTAVRFIVDTGASLVILTPNDAQAAGIRRSELVFDHTVQTGNAGRETINQRGQRLEPSNELGSDFEDNAIHTPGHSPGVGQWLDFAAVGQLL